MDVSQGPYRPLCRSHTQRTDLPVSPPITWDPWGVRIQRAQGGGTRGGGRAYRRSVCNAIHFGCTADMDRHGSAVQCGAPAWGGL